MFFIHIGMRYRSAKGYLFAVLSAIIYGSMPLMARYIYEDGVNPFTLVFLRNFFSIIPLAVLSHKEKKKIIISGKLLPQICLISVLGCSLTPMLLFCSYQFIASGTATVFHFTYPAFVMILDFLFSKKRAQLCHILSVLLCILGISFFYKPDQLLNTTGSVLALLSGVTFAIYVIMLSEFKNGEVSGFVFSFYVALVSSIASLVVCLATDSLTLPSSWLGWGLCVLFSLMVTTGAVVLFQQSTFLIGGGRASILSTLEPITSIAIGVIIFKEPFEIRMLVGTGLVVSASVLTALYDIKRE